MTSKQAILLDRSGRTSLEILSEREVRDLYLPLRYQIYHLEFEFSLQHVRTAVDFWDQYDTASTSLGLFIPTRHLIGAIRIVEATSTIDLPSSSAIALVSGLTAERQVGELSRVMVAKPYRGCGIFAVLLVSAVILARKHGIMRVFISEADRPEYRRFLRSLGFKVVSTDFHFDDGVIAPPILSACFCLDLAEIAEARFDQLKLQRSRLFNAACSRIDASREPALCEIIGRAQG